MKVVHVLEPFASGVVTAVINIIDELPEFEHIVIHGSRTSDSSIEKVRSRFHTNTKFILWKHASREINPLKDLFAFFELRSYLSKYKDSVIHLHSSKAGFLGRVACWTLGIKKVIYTPHCGAFIRTDISKSKRFFYKKLEQFGGLFGGLVVGCGESEGKLYSELGLKTKFVNNGTDSLINIEPENKVMQIVFAGIANDQKNPELFNEIAEKIKPYRDINFIWIGDGDLRYKLVSNNITVTGWVSKEAVNKYLAESAIYLSTSNWEGLPFGVIEAMNSSCALVLHNVPGNKDLVREGENGFLFNTADEAVNILAELSNNIDQTKQLGLKSAKIAKEYFSKKKMGEGYKNIYLNI